LQGLRLASMMRMILVFSRTGRRTDTRTEGKHNLFRAHINITPVSLASLLVSSRTESRKLCSNDCNKLLICTPRLSAPSDLQTLRNVAVNSSLRSKNRRRACYWHRPASASSIWISLSAGGRIL